MELRVYEIEGVGTTYSFISAEDISKIGGLPPAAIIGFCESNEKNDVQPTNETFRSHRPFKDLMHGTIATIAPRTRELQTAVAEGVKINGGKEFYVFVIDRRCVGCPITFRPPYVFSDHAPSSDNRAELGACNIIGSFRVNNKILVADSYQRREQHLVYVDGCGRRGDDFFVIGGFFQLLPEIYEALIEAFCASLQHSVEAEMLVSVKAGLLAPFTCSRDMQREIRCVSDADTGADAGAARNSTDSSWLHGAITRKDAEALVKEAGGRDGTFLVSEQDPEKGKYTLTVVHRGGPTHHQMAPNAHGIWTIDKSVLTHHTDMIAMINALGTPGVKGWPVPLQIPVPCVVPPSIRTDGDLLMSLRAGFSRFSVQPDPGNVDVPPPQSPSASQSQLLSSSAAAAADPAKGPGFHTVPVGAEMLMSLKAGVLAPPACPEATDPDHPSEYCSKCMDYAGALRVAADTLEEMPVYTCYVEGVGQCLTFLSNADVEEIGLLPTAGIIGVWTSHSEHEKSFGEINGSGTNPSFTEVMHQAIAAAAPHPDAHIAAGAPKNGGKEGWVYMIDPRTPTPEGSVPPSDIVGSFKVDRETQTVVKDSYRPNEHFQLLSDQGHGLCQLRGMHYAAMVKVIKTCTVGFALAQLVCSGSR